MSQAAFDVDEVQESFRIWLEAQSKDTLVAYAERLADQVPDATPLGMVRAWPTTRTACWRKHWLR